MKKSAHGFTLIELLVVISIIAVLSVIGIALYTNAQKSARDTARRADIDAISKALEVSKGTGGYVVLSSGQFAKKVVPLVDLQNRPYCINSVADVVQADPAVWTTTSCPANYISVAENTTPLGTSGSITAWKVCASLESGSGSVFCKANSQ